MKKVWNITQYNKRGIFYETNEKETGNTAIWYNACICIFNSGYGEECCRKKEISATAQKVEHVIENQNTRLLNNNVPAGLANSIEDNIVEMGKYSSDTRYLTGVAPRENDVITQGEKL